ncbi:uncharacterized protein LOC144144689 [Haemaphysalis longicornis]
MIASQQNERPESLRKTSAGISGAASQASRSISGKVSRGLMSLRHSFAIEVAESDPSSPHRSFYPPPVPHEEAHHEEERSAKTFSWDASVLACSSSIFWVLLDVVVKLNPSIRAPKFFFHFSSGIFVGSMTLMAGVAEPYGPLDAQGVLFMRSVCVTVALFARIFSLRFMTVVDAFTVSSLGPLLTLLPECRRAGRRGVTVGCLVALGMAAVAIGLVIYSKKYSSNDAAATTRFAAGLVLTIAASVLRSTSRYFNSALWYVPSVVQSFHTSFVSLIVSVCLVALFDNMHHLYNEVDMGTMVFLAQLAFAYNLSLTKAHNLESFGVVHIVVYTLDAVLSMIASLLVLEEQVTRLGYCAAALVMGAVLLVELHHMAGVDADKSRKRRWFAVLTVPLFGRRPRPGDGNPEPEAEVVHDDERLNWRDLPQA